MSSARAKSAHLFLNKRKSLAFLGVLAIGGLIPTMAHAQTAGSKAPAKPAQQILPPADEYLTQADALGAIPDLNISISSVNANKSAMLTGLVPNACAGMISVASTTTDASMISGKTSGFSILAKKGFISCVQKQTASKGSCETSATVVSTCTSLSSIGRAAAIALPANETVSVAYLNKLNNDAAVGDNWSAVNFGNSALISYSQADLNAQAAAKAADAKAKHDAALQAAILKCAQSRDGINDARESLANSGLDQDTIDDLTAKIDEYQKRFDSADLKSLQNKVNQAISNNKFDQFDDLEDSIYDYYNAHSSQNPKVGDQLAQMIYDMAKARATQTDATNADIDKAQATLNRALDEDTGLNLSEKNQATFQQALNMEIPKFRLEAAYRACDENSYNFSYARQSMYSTPSMNPQATVMAINGDYQSAQKACKAANKMYDEQMKSLTKQMKENKCSAISSSGGGPTSLFGGSSSSDSSSSNGGRCQAISDQITGLSTGVQQVYSDVTQEAQEAIQNAMPQQLPVGNLSMPSAQQMPQQMPIVSPNTMYGPQRPMFSNPMAGGYSGYTGGMSYGGAQPVMIPTNGGSASTMGTPYYSGYYYQQNPQGVMIN